MTQRFKAFSLSEEVLLVLEAIAVIVAITIPLITDNIKEEQLKTEWNKSFSKFDQASALIAKDNRGNLTRIFNTDDDPMNAFAKYMNFIKSCPKGTIYGNCWHQINTGKYLYGGTATWSDASGAILDSGELIRISKTIGTNATLGANTSICIDVNGFKSPNTVGKDIFYMYVTNKGIKAWGTKDDQPDHLKDTTCINDSTDSTNTGFGCSDKYLYK